MPGKEKNVTTEHKLNPVGGAHWCLRCWSWAYIHGSNLYPSLPVGIRINAKMSIHVENLLTTEANSASNLLKHLIRKQVHVGAPAPVTDNSENSSAPTKQSNMSFFRQAEQRREKWCLVSGCVVYDMQPMSTLSVKFWTRYRWQVIDDFQRLEIWVKMRESNAEIKSTGGLYVFME